MIKFLNKIKDPKVSELGGKGYSLVVLINNGFNVPKGFVITSEVFFKFLEDNNLTERIKELYSEINDNNFQEKSKEIKELIINGKMPEEITQEIKENLNELSVQHVAIRSSAVSEDSLKASFAGLHDTFLNVNSDLVLENLKKCWASLFNERAVIYRIKKNIPHLVEGMAIIIQEMIPAEVSGITLTIHPSNEKALLIESSYGLGDLIVSGRIQPDDYIVDRETLVILEIRIGVKKRMDICEEKGTEIVEINKELIEMQVIPDEKIQEIAKICSEIGKIFDHPQDIEWCIYNNKIWLLQSRPITWKSIQ
ncbi:MAG: PEP/pyruvate-binding domain-containing protein [Candidatus Cloacimonetes bacterium]|nr:PEP/pyruvate-binding domain-containing protein [Candidatus Cloacimonadota bacterium]